MWAVTIVVVSAAVVTLLEVASAATVAEATEATTGAAETAETAEAAIETTAHGAERIAGAAATSGGVLGAEEIAAARASGQVLTQADGAAVHVVIGRTLQCRGSRTAGNNHDLSEHLREISRAAGEELWMEGTVTDIKVVVCCFCGVSLPERKGA
jgi:hypothetical protein